MGKNSVIFLDIDTQFDFINPYGKLSVPNATEIIPNLKLLIEFGSLNNIPIVSTVDAHDYDDSEFNNFPKHCIKNSIGAEKIEETLTKNNTVITNNTNLQTLQLTKNRNQLIVQKQTIDIFENKNIEAILKLFGLKEFVVFGVTTEYCVKYAVVGLLNQNYSVYLVSDAIKHITNKDGNEAICEMKKAGAKLILTKQVLRIGS